MPVESGWTDWDTVTLARLTWIASDIQPLGYMGPRPGSFCVLTSAVPGLKHLKLIRILLISILIPTRQKTGNMYFRASADAELGLG